MCQWYYQVAASHLFRCCSCQSQQWTRQHGSACSISSWIRRPVLSSVMAGLQGEKSRAIHPSGRNPQPRRGYWGCSLREKHSKKDLLGATLDNLPIVAYVDNKSLVEAVQSTKLVDDKRLRLDIGAVKEYLDTKQLSSLNGCPGVAQLANCLTKRGVSGLQLLTVLQSGKLDRPDL